MPMYVWEDGTVTGSINVEQLLAEHPDHPVSKQILAEREAAPEPEVEVDGGEGRRAAVEDPEDETVESLKEQLRERGLPVSGNKAELVERLREAEEES